MHVYYLLQMLHPGQGWTGLCPALSAGQLQKTMHTLDAWSRGSLPLDARLDFPLVGMRQPKPLRELMDVPMSAWKNLAGQILQRAVNARALGWSSEQSLPPYCLELIGRSPFSMNAGCHPSALSLLKGA